MVFQMNQVSEFAMYFLLNHTRKIKRKKKRKKKEYVRM